MRHRKKPRTPKRAHNHTIIVCTYFKKFQQLFAQKCISRTFVQAKQAFFACHRYKKAVSASKKRPGRRMTAEYGIKGEAWMVVALGIGLCYTYYLYVLHVRRSCLFCAKIIYPLDKRAMILI